MITRHVKPFTFGRGKPAKASAVAATAIERGEVAARRFEMGASSLGADEFLRRCGYDVKQGKMGSTFTVRQIDGGGRARTMTRSELMAFLDAQRVAKGLQPLKRGRAA